MVKVMGSDFELHAARIGFVKFVALLFFLSRFVCDNCLKKTGRTRKENKFSAKSKSDVSVSVFDFHSLCQRISSFASICQILAFSLRLAMIGSTGAFTKWGMASPEVLLAVSILKT